MTYLLCVGSIVHSGNSVYYEKVLAILLERLKANRGFNSAYQLASFESISFVMRNSRVRMIIPVKATQRTTEVLAAESFLGPRIEFFLQNKTVAEIR